MVLLAPCYQAASPQNRDGSHQRLVDRLSGILRLFGTRFNNIPRVYSLLCPRSGETNARPHEPSVSSRTSCTFAPARVIADFTEEVITASKLSYPHLSIFTRHLASALRTAPSCQGFQRWLWRLRYRLDYKRQDSQSAIGSSCSWNTESRTHCSVDLIRWR